VPQFEGNLEVLFGPPGVEIFRKNAAKYARLAETPQTRDNEPVSVGHGQWAVELEMPSHSVWLLRLSASA